MTSQSPVSDLIGDTAAESARLLDLFGAVLAEHDDREPAYRADPEVRARYQGEALALLMAGTTLPRPPLTVAA